ncbi:Histidine protein kinase DivJ [Bremerella volcania]|uniref:histidine kinase n=1 Tax=Bremerella volcania TaxID=2527984 RepID=A0A518C583_9BACT|nr:HAMP domain-containing sensor histidine kinase [Bremerella volcania]QDU74382.1 Histidine protein kinase DivJ [Bremerella volcania]
MSYRSIKRVLGETNLERKCRFLYGTCLLLLITGSFWWYGQSTEQLVHNNNLSTGRHLVDAVLMKIHWKHDAQAQKNPEGWDEHVRDTGLELEYMKYDWEVMTLDPADRKLAATSRPDERILLPANEEEAEILRRLKEIQQTRDKDILEKFLSTPGISTQETTDEFVELGRGDADNDEDTIAYSPASEAFYDAQRQKYIYYQPIYWKRNCTVACHNTNLELAVSTTGFPLENELPFNVIKIVKDDEITQIALTKNRAYLLATAIITVALSMIALYLIVRYIIVKPLTHLRDVSDEVSQGHMDVRAEIYTGDEFEDLATSFNRMLAHLIDAQNKLTYVNRDLDGKVDQLAQANMQLYEMNCLKSDFLASMSHELRTPLNSILGFSDVLRGIDSLNDKQKRYVENIQKSGRLLLDMINDILDLAKVESGRMEVRPSQFSVASVVSGACDMVRSLTEEKNIDLTCHVDPNEEPALQDQSKFQQILTNLLSNAIKFTPEGGRIVVKANRINNRLELSVSDTGVGIAEEDREIIFEKFRQGTVSQGDTLTREYSGTGLGLSIVRELCQLLGGTVRAESELGKGSTFFVDIPWVIEDRPDVREDSFTSRIDEITKAKHGDFVRIQGSRQIETPETIDSTTRN